MLRSQFVCFFQCLNAAIPLTCTLANEYPSSNEISKKNSSVRGLYRLRCLVTQIVSFSFFSSPEPKAPGELIV